MKQTLLAQGVTDVLYEGSNVSQLSSIVSYVIATLNANTAMNLQETLLPLATKRMNILFGARQLGYEPHAVKSYKYELTLKPQYDKTKTITLPDGTEIIDTNNTEERKITLVRNTRFKAGDKYYYYVGPTLIDVISVSNYDIQYINNPDLGKPKEEILLKIPVVEGFMTTYMEDEMLLMTASDYVENGETKTKQDYIIPYTDVEEDYGLQVFLTYVDDDGFYVIDEEWTKSDQFLIDENIEYNKRKFVRKENIILGYPTIFFQFAGLGNGIRSGTQIKVNVLQSSGADGEAQEDFAITDVNFSEEMEVIDYKLIEKGRVFETDDEIKDNAIVFKNTGNRAVTKYDYISITKRHPLVNEADAWGGEDETPKAIGNIWVSCTPSEHHKPIVEFDDGFYLDIGTCSKDNISSPLQKNWRNWYLTDEEYQQIFGYLEPYKIMTMDLNYRHPLYINFYYKIDIIKYDMTKSKKTIHKYVFNTLNDYFERKLEKYETEYLNSNIQRILDAALDYKGGVNIELKLTGTLCEEMIDQYKRKHENRNLIITNLAFPYESIFDANGIITNKLPKIDGPFGVSGGSIEVMYDELNNSESPVETRKTATIKYTPAGSDTSIDFGQYIVDKEKLFIELVFDFDKVSVEEIFGPEKEDDYGTYREYIEFPINYFPYDNNLVNLSFDRNKIPRLKEVIFGEIQP
jgi:hypothetical protein